MKSTKIRVVLTIGIFLLAAISYLDRTNISVAGVMIMPEFGIGQQQLGYVLTAFLIGYGAFQVPAGWLAKRFGPRKVLTFGLLWWGLLTGAVTLVSPGISGAFWIILAVRFLLGMGEAVMYPSSNQFTSTWIPTEERGKANGLIFAGTGTGAALTSPIVNYLMTHYGWRQSFWFSALVGIAAGVVWWWYARDKPEEHKGVNAAELAHIKAGLNRGKADGAAIPVPWGRILASRNIWLLAFAYFCFCYVAFIFLSWFFIYLAKARGLQLNTSAFYSMLPPTMMVVGSIGGGVFSDWLTRVKGAFGGRCVSSTFALLSTAVFLVIGAHAVDPIIATIVLAGGAGALYLSQSAYWALAADIGGPHAGVIAGFMNTLGMLGAAITASATPFFADIWGWEAAFYVGAVFAVAGALSWLLIDPKGRVHHEENEQVEA